MVSEPLIYSRRLASGLRTQKREREIITLTLEKRSVKRGGLTFSSAPTHEDEVLDVTGTPIQSRARSFDREEMLCTVFNIAARPVMSCADAHMPGAGKNGNIFPISNSRQRRACDVRRDQVRSGRCCRLRMCRRSGRCSRSGDREDIADRKDIADREDYQGVADRADVPDREIGKILPIGNIFPIGKMIVLFIFRSNFNRV
jgi:hypothetical protein